MRNGIVATVAVALVQIAAVRPCLAADEPPAPTTVEPAAPSAYRFALTPSWTHAFVRRSVSSDAIGLSLQTLFGTGSRFGVGVTGALYAPFTQSTALVPASFPKNETLGSLLVEFSWLAVRGQRAELGVLAGVGTISTRPLSVIDRAHRTFTYDTRLALSGGAFARVHITREVALTLDARNVIYVDQQENGVISDRTPNDPSSWYGDKPIVSMLEARLGLTVFLFGREP